MISDLYLTIPQYRCRFPLSDKTVRRRIADGSLQIYQPGGPGTKILIVIKNVDGTSELGILPNSPPPKNIPQMNNAGVAHPNQSQKPTNLKKPRGGFKPRWQSQTKFQQSITSLRTPMDMVHDAYASSGGFYVCQETDKEKRLAVPISLGSFSQERVFFTLTADRINLCRETQPGYIILGMRHENNSCN